MKRSQPSLREIQDELPLGSDPDRSWYHPHTSTHSHCSQLVNILFTTCYFLSTDTKASMRKKFFQGVVVFWKPLRHLLKIKSIPFLCFSYLLHFILEHPFHFFIIYCLFYLLLLFFLLLGICKSIESSVQPYEDFHNKIYITLHPSDAR